MAYLYLVADLRPGQLRLVEVGFALLFAAVWFWQGSSLLPVIAWLIPLATLYAFDPAARGAPVAASILWVVVRSAAWFGVWLIYCTAPGRRVWGRFTQGIAEQAFRASVPGSDRAFYRAFAGTFDIFRVPTHAPPQSRDETIDLLRMHRGALEALDPPSEEWKRARAAAVRAAEEQLRWLERGGRAPDEDVRAAVDARSEAIVDAKSARSVAYRALRWQPVRRS